MVIGEPKKFTGALCQNLTQLKFSSNFYTKFINHMFKINAKVMVSIQQCLSIQTSFFCCEPQIGFQISQSTKRTFICSVVTGPVLNI